MTAPARVSAASVRPVLVSGEHGDRLHDVRTVLRAAVPSETVERVNGVVTHFTPPPKGGSGMDRSARRYCCSQDRQHQTPRLAVPFLSQRAAGVSAHAGASVSGPSASYAVAEGLETGGAPDWSLSNRERKAAHVTPQQGGQTKRSMSPGRFEEWAPRRHRT